MTDNTFARQALLDCYEGTGSAEQQKSVAAYVVLLQDLVLRMREELASVRAQSVIERVRENSDA